LRIFPQAFSTFLEACKINELQHSSLGGRNEVAKISPLQAGDLGYDGAQSAIVGWPAAANQVQAAAGLSLMSRTNRSELP
jgi:hypothetical protein